MWDADDSKATTVQWGTTAQRASQEGLLPGVLHKALPGPSCCVSVPGSGTIFLYVLQQFPRTAEKVVCPLAKTEPVKGCIGGSLSVLGPNHRMAKRPWSQGQREEGSFLTSSRLVSCCLSSMVAFYFRAAGGL